MYKKLNNWISRLKILRESEIYREVATDRIELLEHIKTKIEEELN